MVNWNLRGNESFSDVLVGGLCCGWSCPHVSSQPPGYHCSLSRFLQPNWPQYDVLGTHSKMWWEVRPRFDPPPGLKWSSTVPSVYLFPSMLAVPPLIFFAQQSLLILSPRLFSFLSLQPNLLLGINSATPVQTPKEEQYVLRVKGPVDLLQGTGAPRTLPFSCHRGREGPVG